MGNSKKLINFYDTAAAIARQAELLHSYTERASLGICSRNVVEGRLPGSTAAIAIKVASVAGGTYYIGLFVYTEQLLTNAPKRQLSAAAPEDLRKKVLSEVIRQMKAKLAGLEELGQDQEEVPTISA